MTRSFLLVLTTIVASICDSAPSSFWWVFASGRRVIRGMRGRTASGYTHEEDGCRMYVSHSVRLAVPGLPCAYKAHAPSFQVRVPSSFDPSPNPLLLPSSTSPSNLKPQTSKPLPVSSFQFHASRLISSQTPQTPFLHMIRAERAPRTARKLCDVSFLRF